MHKNQVADVLSHVPDISDDAAQLAIDSCRNNEVSPIPKPFLFSYSPSNVFSKTLTSKPPSWP